MLHILTRIAQQPSDGVALCQGDSSLTYAQLEQLSDKWAEQLQIAGVQRGQIVATLMPPSIEWVVAIVALWKCDAAYLPLDPNHPPQRNAFALQDSRANILTLNALLHNNLAAQIAIPAHFSELPRTNIDDKGNIVLVTVYATQTAKSVEKNEKEKKSENEAEEESHSKKEDENGTAYLIYTSGSTGKPKGVPVSHKNLAHTIGNLLNFFAEPPKRHLLLFSVAFDGAVASIFHTLAAGGNLIIPKNDDEKEPAHLLRTIEQQQVTYLLCLPSLYRALLDNDLYQQLTSLQTVVVAGETCPPNLPNRHFQHLPQCAFFNAYGPTEATIWASTYRILPQTEYTQAIPIGKPLGTTQMALVDEQQQLIAQHSEIGEIWIAGNGVVQGYWERPELDKQKFGKLNANTPYPDNLTWYKTGDLAYMLPDQNLVFVGRADEQVKLNGYRIELGEIENVFALHPDVLQCVVVLKGLSSSQPRLVAYMTAINKKKLLTEQIRSFVAQYLPDYMIPAVFVELAQMPLNPNGKIDRKALPEPPQTRPPLNNDFVAPQTDEEKYIVLLWQQILGIDAVGVNDKFFELGGTSLLAAQFTAKIQQLLEQTVFITTLFDHPTPKQYAAFLKREYNKNTLKVPDINTKNTLQVPSLKPYLIYPEKCLVRSIQAPSKHEKYTEKGGKRAIFILAPPRSGTSLLSFMLAQHPCIYAANELQLLHFDQMQQRADAYSGKFALWKQGLLETIAQIEQCPINIAQQISAEWEHAGVDTRQVYHFLLQRINDPATNSNTKADKCTLSSLFLLDKSPSYALDPNALMRAEDFFEQPLYIHLFRNPQGMVQSFKKMNMHQAMYIAPHPFAPHELGENVWCESHENILAFLQNIPHQRQYTVSYEKLVQEPEKVMRHLCQTLELPYTPELIRPYEQTRLKNQSDRDFANPMSDPKLWQQTGINPILATQWQEEQQIGLSQETISLFEVLATKQTIFQSTNEWTNIEAKEEVKGEGLEQVKGQSQAQEKGKKQEKGQKQERKQHQEDTPNDVFALVGMALRVPGADNLHEFWHNLLYEKDPSLEADLQDLLREGLPAEWLDDERYVRRYLSLRDPDCFDAAFFGYLPKEAALIDPQHRVLLECAYAALEHAACDTASFEGIISLFGGIARNAYLTHNIVSHPDLAERLGDYDMALATEKDFAFSRIAYKLNLRGAAVNVQTACSTGGTALHLACQSLLLRECDIALVGGGRINTQLNAGYWYTEGGPLSPDGYCRAFDAKAKGMVRANGMVCLVLKRLDDALQQHDTIYATIRATALNNDGSDKIGFTAPSIEGQAQAMIKAYQKAQIKAQDLSYIEAHGTGTLIGDPIEIAALAQAFGTENHKNKEPYCAIGSVKTNIGHLDAGACLASIVKVALAMKHELLPANLHFEKPNPNINFDNTPFFVNDRLRAWKRMPDKPRLAAVNSLGLGGNNVHIVMQEAPELPNLPEKRTYRLLCLSAQTPAALEQVTRELAQHLEQRDHIRLSDAAYTLHIGRRQMPLRRMLVCADKHECIGLLNEQHPAKVFSNAHETPKQGIVFLFSGGGAQYVQMCRDLWLDEPVFAETLRECTHLLQEKANIDFDICQYIYPNETLNEIQNELATALLNRPEVALPVLFSVEYALTKLWDSWGIQPSEMLGHSMGEYVAACIAGVWSLTDALRLVAKRGQLFAKLPQGTMLNIAVSEQVFWDKVKQNDTHVGQDNPFQLKAYDYSIAAINRAEQCVVAGTKEAIERLQAFFVQQNIESKLVPISVAAHSHLVEEILPDFADFLQTITFNCPNTPFISNISGNFIAPQQAMSPDYWLQHLRQTVRFYDGLHTVLQLPDRILLEVGPGQTLASIARQHSSRQSATPILASVRHTKERVNDHAFILKTLGQLWLYGCSVDWKGFYRSEPLQKVPLNTYPFARQKHWIVPITTQEKLEYFQHLIHEQNALSARNILPNKLDNKKPIEITHNIDHPIIDEQNEKLLNNNKIDVMTQSHLVLPLLHEYIGKEYNDIFQSLPQNITNQVKHQTNQQMNFTTKTTRIERINAELKGIFYELSGIAPNDMDNYATFMELGFDSLFLTQAIVQLNKHFGTQLQFRQLFEDAPDMASLTVLLDKKIPADKWQTETETEIETAINAPSNGAFAKEQSQQAQQNNASNQQTNSTTQLLAQMLSATPYIDLINHTNQEQERRLSVEQSTLSKVIFQQLALMQQQLNMLVNTNANAGLAIRTDISNNSVFPTAEKNLSEVPKIVPNHLPTKNGEILHPNKGNFLEKEKAILQDSIAQNAVMQQAQEKSEGHAHGPWKPTDKRQIGIDEHQRKHLDAFIERYAARTKGSKTLAQEQRKHLADARSITGFHKLWKEMVYQIAAERSDGAYIWDIDGNKYIDFTMGFGINLFGHNPDFVKKAISEQLDKGLHLATLTPWAKTVADLLCSITGCERATFVNTGSEGVAAAIRAARTVTGKPRIAVFEGDYHGISDELLVKGVRIKGKMMSRPVSPGIPDFLVQNMLVLDYDDPNLFDIIAEHAHELAAIVVEPITPQFPHIQRKELLQQLRQITLEKDIAFVFDELITGFRLHPRGAQGWFGIDADICSYGKIVCGGLPMAALAGKSRFLDVFDGGHWQFGDDSFPSVGVTFFGGTFARHPLSLATAHAALTHIAQNGQTLYNTLNERTARYAQRVKNLFEKYRVPLAVYSAASIVAIKVTDSNPLSRLFFFMMREKGVHLNERAGFLSTAHTDEDLAWVLQIIETCLIEMKQAQFFAEQTQTDSNDRWGHIVYPHQYDKKSSISDMSLSTYPHILPLTDTQQEVWLGNRLEGLAASSYNLSSVFHCKGKLHVPYMQAAIQKLIDRYDVLRSTFQSDGLHQYIKTELILDIPIKDLRYLDQNTRQEALQHLLDEEVEKPFELEEGPMIRASIIVFGEQDYYVLLTLHHIIADGWSMGILSRKLSIFYSSMLTNTEPMLSAKPKQLGDYLQELNTVQVKKSETFWLKKLEGELPVLNFPTDKARPLNRTYRAGFQGMTIQPELFGKLKSLANKHNTTIFSLLLAAFKVFLHRMSSQDDLLFGVVAAGQSAGDNQLLVGHYVSLLPLRTQVNDLQTFKDVLLQTRTEVLDIFEYQYTTLNALLKQLKMPRDATRSPIVSVIFNMDSPTGKLHFEGMDVDIEPIPRKYETYDLFFNIKPLTDTVAFECTFAKDLFEQSTIAQYLAVFGQLLQGIVENSNCSVGTLSILPDQALSQVLDEWAKCVSPCSKDLTTAELISLQAQKTPQRIALTDTNRSYTYKELDEWSSQIAHYLRTKTNGNNSLIAVFMERGAALVASLLGIWKAGAGYVPIDLNTPKERAEDIMKDAQIGILLSDGKYIEKQAQGNFETILLDNMLPIVQEMSAFAPSKIGDFGRLAYVLYTSGSTGKPKGVAIRHSSVSNLLEGLLQLLPFDQNDTLFAIASVAFDISVAELFLPLICGAKVVVASQKAVADGLVLRDELEKANATWIDGTPATYQMLFNAGWNGNNNIKIICTGEALPFDLSQKLTPICAELWNGYGPTEATVWASFKRIAQNGTHWQNEINNNTITPPIHLLTGYEPIGKPIANTYMYILDNYMQPVPPYVPGNLYLGGAGIAKEYLNRPELSAEKFRTNPYQKLHPDAPILYATGDVARWLPNGDIEYLNRSDNQVKIRGYRIELGEVEAVLARHETVRENVVIARPDKQGQKRLLAYVVAHNKKDFDAQQLSEFMQQYLPEYMIPAAFVCLDALPLTVSLKIDRKALPEPENAQEKPYQYLPPETPTQQHLTFIWQDLLGVAPIGIKENFFELGGHSLKAVAMMAQIEKIFGKRLPLAALLEHSTIKSLAELIDGDHADIKWDCLVPVKPNGNKPPLYIVHGAGLHVLLFNTLADYVDDTQPVYALQAHGLNGKDEPFDNIEDIARHYISEIVRHNPTGPYHLAGYSMGGIIAFEMAQQLVRAGKIVKTLGMFDAVAPHYLNGQIATWEKIQKIGKKLGHVLTDIVQNPSEAVRYQAEVARRRWNHYLWRLSASDANKKEDAAQEAMLKIEHKNAIALQNYRPLPYSGIVHLFRAEERRYYISDTVYLGWAQYANGGVKIYQVPGDHQTLFSPPNNRVFARQLQRCLDGQ